MWFTRNVCLIVYVFSFLFFLIYFIFVTFFGFVFFRGGVLLDFFVFSCFGLDVSFSFLFDFVSLGFFGCVSFISIVVFFFRVFYMEGTIDYRRFFWLVFLFVFSMLLLVFSGNFFVTMVGWDGLGLVSFCLVVFYSNSQRLESGLVTVFSNRVGDVFFLLSFLFFFCFGFFRWEISSYKFLYFFLVFLFLGAITKRAQIPFSAWLPAAMAAPTPVSSLVHSSTLVTAGVYILIRFNYVFFYFCWGFFKAFFLFTIVLAGFCAVFESDLKKVVAMSTLSQLGIIMFILSRGIWVIAFLHIIIHAFFKRMLFLRTGSLMGQMGGLQDSRYYGSGVFSFRSFLFFVVSRMCLGGFPFFLGFYSKDYIISSRSFFEGTFFYYLFILGCFTTVVYRFRLIYTAYFLGFIYLGHFSHIESSNFFIFVVFIFFKCWILGGAVYWAFLSDSVFFFTFFDLFLGVALFIFGVLLFLFFKHLYFSSFFLFNIFGLKWGFSTGRSFLFRGGYVTGYEKTWLESLGGSGLYSFLNKGAFFVSIFDKIYLGLLITFFVFFNFYFFYFCSYFNVGFEGAGELRGYLSLISTLKRLNFLLNYERFWEHSLA